MLAARKNFSVKEGIMEGKWMRGLHRINSETQMDRFIQIWAMLQNIQLVNSPDSYYLLEAGV